MKTSLPIAFVLIVFLVMMSTSSRAQKINVTLKDRGFVQQHFAIDFLRKRDSLYYAQHNQWEPFTSPNAIDAFIYQFERAWKYEAATNDSNCQRIDSYVYGLIERSKRADKWSEGYVWKNYMLPSFLSDFTFCLTTPTPDNASFLWPGNAGNIFAYALDYDLASEEWRQLNTAYSQMPALLDKYISFKAQSDSNLVKSLISTRDYIASLRNFYAVSDAMHSEQLDKALAILATGFSERSNPVKYLSRPLQKLASRYSKAGKPERALAILDIAARSTIDADIPRDSLREWYQKIDPLNGPSRFETISGERGSPILVPTGKQVQLSGHYTDLVTGEPFDLSSVAGKTLLIDFWATWCSPCVAEIPPLNAFVKRFSDRRDFAFVSISSDAIEGGASESFVREFVKKKAIKYVVIYDRTDSSLTRKFAVTGWPTKYVISPAGEILQRSGKTSNIDIKVVEEYLARKQ